MRLAAVALIRRPMHDGQKPRPLLLKTTSRLSPHPSHLSRAKPQSSTVMNLGGVTSVGQRVIPLRFISSQELRFTRPPDAQAGPAFVEVLNPPYIPFSSSGNGSTGALTFP